MDHSSLIAGGSVDVVYIHGIKNWTRSDTHRSGGLRSSFKMEKNNARSLSASGYVYTCTHAFVFWWLGKRCGGRRIETVDTNIAIADKLRN